MGQKSMQIKTMRSPVYDVEMEAKLFLEDWEEGDAAEVCGQWRELIGNV